MWWRHGKKTISVLIWLGRKIAIGGGSQTELKLGRVQISVKLDDTNGGEIFWMCASVNMAIYAREVTKLEVNAIWLHYIQVVLNFSIRMMPSWNMKLNRVSWIHPDSWSSIIVLRRCGPLYHNKCFLQCWNQNAPIALYFLCCEGWWILFVYSCCFTYNFICFDDVWTNKFPPGKNPGIKPATFEVVNDLKDYSPR